MANPKTAVIIPNWNGKHRMAGCLDSLKNQVELHDVIVVDNGSVDGSADFIAKQYPHVTVLKNRRNLGFAGGVNTGLRFALAQGYDYLALLNNDAIAKNEWLSSLVKFLNQHAQAGIVTSKIYEMDGRHLDSTGENYSVWGLPFPRGRGEVDKGQYDQAIWVLGASGGASLYRAKMLSQIGLFDEGFFAYYEDVDISFRAQLAGWKVGFEQKAQVLHQIGATSSSIAGFTTYHTLKNLPIVFWKDLPWPIFRRVYPRLAIAYLMIACRALLRGQFGALFKGIFMGRVLWLRSLFQRRRIQRSRKVTVDYIASLITYDLPPNAANLRELRSKWWKLRGRHA